MPIARHLHHILLFLFHRHTPIPDIIGDTPTQIPTVRINLSPPMASPPREQLRIITYRRAGNGARTTGLENRSGSGFNCNSWSCSSRYSGSSNSLPTDSGNSS